MDNRIVIAVDGLAGTGKSTLSNLLARKLGCIHFSTGSVYRAVGYLVLLDDVDPSDEQAVTALLDRHDLSLVVDPEGVSAAVSIDGRVVSSELQSPEVSEATSKISSLPSVRMRLTALQRGAFEGKAMVVEGRDIGTVIFPDAPLKFFIKIDEQVAIERRVSQLAEDLNISGEDELRRLRDKMEIEISERDQRDLKRAVAPTRPADDAVIIDNSSETLTCVVQTMYDAAALRGLV